jgi:hypothetical protein
VDSWVFISIHLLMHKSDSTLILFLQICGFTGSNICSPFSMTLTLRLNFCDLHFNHNLNFSLVMGVGLQSILFFHACESDRPFLYT